MKNAALWLGGLVVCTALLAIGAQGQSKNLKTTGLLNPCALEAGQIGKIQGVVISSKRSEGNPTQWTSTIQSGNCPVGVTFDGGMANDPLKIVNTPVSFTASVVPGGFLGNIQNVEITSTIPPVPVQPQTYQSSVPPQSIRVSQPMQQCIAAYMNGDRPQFIEGVGGLEINMGNGRYARLVITSKYWNEVRKNNFNTFYFNQYKEVVGVAQGNACN